MPLSVSRSNECEESVRCSGRGTAIQPKENSGREPRWRVALGPENPAFGSWNWLGADLAEELSADTDVTVFREMIPAADVLVFLKFLPDIRALGAVRERSAIVFCPVDVYGSAAEIDGDAQRLRCCDQIVVHAQRLRPYFQSYAPTLYLDHHSKYVAPTRWEIVAEGPVLWVGERSNLPAVVEWVNWHELPGELVVLTNVPQDTTPVALGFRDHRPIRVEVWSPESHRRWLPLCRAAFDIKGDDFRAHHKPPAKALDFLASGIPLAMHSQTSSAEHLRELGFELPEPEETDRWLSAEYAQACQQFGRLLGDRLSLSHLGRQWRVLLQQVAARRGRTVPRSETSRSSSE